MAVVSDEIVGEVSVNAFECGHAFLAVPCAFVVVAIMQPVECTPADMKGGARPMPSVRYCMYRAAWWGIMRHSVVTCRFPFLQHFVLRSIWLRLRLSIEHCPMHRYRA